MGSIPCLPTSKFARKKLQCSYKDPEMYKANLQGVFCEDILWDYLGLGQDTPATDIEFKTKAILD
jgi:oligoendopeptidase F